MIFGRNDATFLNNVVDGFNRFGIKLEEKETGSSKDVLKLKMFDTIHEGAYFAIAKKDNSGKKAERDWNKIIENDLIPSIRNYKEYGDIPAAALIIPVNDVDKVTEMLRGRGLVPTVYQLISDYVVAGLKKQDLIKLIEEKEEPEPEAENKTIDTNKEVDDVISVASTVENQATPKINKNKPTVKHVNDMPLSKKLLVAALLGVVAGSLPFVAKIAFDKRANEQANSEREVFKKVVDRYIYDIKHGYEPDEDVLHSLALNPNTAEKQLRELADTPVGISVLKNKNVPEDLLAPAINSDDVEKRAAAAANPSTPLSDLVRLSYDKSPIVRAEVAKNPAITHDVMERLVKDVPEVRESLLENTSLTPDILDKLTNSGATENCDFKRKMMSNPCISKSTLAYNARNPDECIRSGVASNPNTPQDVIDDMVNDESLEVKSLALKNPNISQEKVVERFMPNWLPDRHNPILEFERMALLENPIVSPKTLARAILLDESGYSLPVARNKSTTPDLLAYINSFAKGKAGLNNFIRDSLKNSNSPDFASDVQKKAAELNESVPTTLRRILNKDFMKNVYNPSDTLRILRKTPIGKLHTVAKSKILNNKATNEERLNANSESDFPEGNIFDSIDEVPIEFTNMVKPELKPNENSIPPEIEQAIFDTADKIVNEVMKSVEPRVMSNIGLGSEGKRSGFGNSMNNSIGNLNYSSENDNEINSEPTNNTDWLFKNSCEQLDYLSEQLQ